MITEAEAAAAAPERGFLRQYMRYAGYETDAPLAYHVATGLALMAASAPDDLTIRLGGMHFGTFWSLIVGESGDSHKTTAIKLGEEILGAALPARLGANPRSAEGLIAELCERPIQLIRYPEFGDFLAATGNKNAHIAALREKLTSLYDCSPIGDRLSGREITCEAPRLSVLAGVTPEFLETHTANTDWTAGFMSRWATFAAARERLYHVPPSTNRGLHTRLIAHLQRFADRPAGDCVGLDPEATALWEAWREDLMTVRYRDGASRWARGAISRAGSVALKTALLFGLDYGPGGDDRPWHIPANCMAPAIAIAELHVKSVVWVVDSLCGSAYARSRRIVIDAVGVDGRPRTLGAIMQRCVPRMAKRDVVGVLDGLAEEGETRVVTINGGGTFYVAASAPLTDVAPSGNVIPFSLAARSTAATGSEGLASAAASAHATASASAQPSNAQRMTATAAPAASWATTSATTSAGVIGGGSGSGNVETVELPARERWEDE